ncbi:MAG: hypothetical protein JF615_08030 [Asticcacaulis sp.]|nr:hypothetical protein [Asticcacaulis sp.]
MAFVTPETLTALAPATKRAADYAPALDACLAMAEITTPLRIAHFMAQLCHESGGFRALVENLNYSAAGLLRTFPKRVTSQAQADALVAGGKEAIANAIYGGRMGNVNPGDGYRFIGRGFIMVTGRNNYTLYAKLLGQPLLDHPELLEQPIYAAQASAAYWKTNNINAAADRDDITTVTRLINGGAIGLSERTSLTAKAKTIWTAAVVAARAPAPAPAPPPPPAVAATTATVLTGMLSRYFSKAELTVSQTAARKGIDNTPTNEIWARLTETAKQMDKVRDLLGHAINVNSGYRSEALNAVIGGAPHSAHSLGYAVDFICPAFGTPLQICQKIVTSGLKFDQLIQEGTWVHISFDPRLRQDVKTANFSGGAATYRSGL